MSDFGDVLERLLTEPAFADDPDVALAGYRLEAGLDGTVRRRPRR